MIDLISEAVAALLQVVAIDLGGRQCSRYRACDRRPTRGPTFTVGSDPRVGTKRMRQSF